MFAELSRGRTPLAHNFIELFFMAKAVGIPAAMEQLLKYGKHVLRNDRIDAPHVRQIEAAVFFRVPYRDRRVSDWPVPTGSSLAPPADCPGKLGYRKVPWQHGFK